MAEVRRPDDVNVHLGGWGRASNVRPSTSHARALWRALAGGIEGGILIVLASRPGIVTVLLLGVVALIHALASFATEDPVAYL
jgi:hypothetical protein